MQLVEATQHVGSFVAHQRMQLFCNLGSPVQ